MDQELRRMGTEEGGAHIRLRSIYPWVKDNIFILVATTISRGGPIEWNAAAAAAAVAAAVAAAAPPLFILSLTERAANVNQHFQP